MKEKYLIVSWWKRPLPDSDQGLKDCLPEVEQFDSEEEAMEEGRKKKKRLGSGSKVKIAKVIEEL